MTGRLPQARVLCSVGGIKVHRGVDCSVGEGGHAGQPWGQSGAVNVLRRRRHVVLIFKDMCSFILTMLQVVDTLFN